MLKNVVLPAPLGPIRLTIAPRGHREVDVVAGDQAAELLAHLARARAGRRRRSCSPRVTAGEARRQEPPSTPRPRTRLRARRLGIRPSRAQQHHVTIMMPEDRRTVLRDVEVVPNLLTCCRSRQALVVEPGQDQRAEHHAPDVAHAAEDHHAQDEDRDVEQKSPGNVEPCRSRRSSRRRRRRTRRSRTPRSSSASAARPSRRPRSRPRGSPPRPGPAASRAAGCSRTG